MSGLLESAAAILSNGEKRLQVISQNISNASTPGYKRQISFSSLIEDGSRIGQYKTPLSISTDNSKGKFTESGNVFDFAVIGSGMFMLRDGDSYYYSRGGEFTRNSDGTVENAQGMLLQQAGGGDLEIDGLLIEVTEDGTVLSDGVPVANIGLYESSAPEDLRNMGGAVFSAERENMTESSGSIIRQGVVESSNVVLSDEMINMMANTRQAEMGGQLVRTYDQLIGQAITTFTRSGR